MNYSRLYFVGFLVVVLGFALLFIGSVTSPSSPSTSSSSFGEVIFIGPFPIVFGSGPGAGTLILISVLISLAMIAIFFLSFVLSGRSRTPPYVLKRE